MEGSPGSIHYIVSRLMTNGEGQSGGGLNMETRVGESSEKQTKSPWQGISSSIIVKCDVIEFVDGFMIKAAAVLETAIYSTSGVQLAASTGFEVRMLI